MLKDSTWRLRSSRRWLWVAVAATVVSACADEPVPPAAIAFQPTDRVPPTEVLLVATAEPLLAGLPTPAAPAMETSERAAAQERRRLEIAVGRGAQGVVDQRFQEAFERAHPQLDLVVRVVGERDVVDFVRVGEVDFGVMNGSLSARERHAGLRQEVLGLELFALAVSDASTIQSLPLLRARQILTGQATSWQQVGADGGDIAVVVPADRDELQRGSRLFLNGEAVLPAVVRAGRARDVIDQLLRNTDAIALVRVSTLTGLTGARLLAIDNTPAAPEAFGFGTYPYGNRVHIVTQGGENAGARAFVAFARSEPGRQLLAGELTPAR